MKTLGVVIADGVGFRNFILSDFITLAEKEFDKIIIYSGLIEGVYKDHLNSEKIIIRELDVFYESKSIWFFRKLKEVSHLNKHISFYGINANYEKIKPRKITSFRKLLIKLVFIIANLFHSEKSIKFYEKLQFYFVSKNSEYIKYIHWLKEDKPSVLFFTHQRPYNLVPLFLAANHLNIFTTSFIFSWDNLVSKGRMLAEFDGYFVWSNLMKKELLQFYPNTKETNVFVTGTPQFEPYILDRYKVEKQQFFQKFNLNPDKKIIYYSCGDVSTSKLDPLYIETIIQLIRENKILDSQLIVRTSPAEDATRFKKLKKDFPEILWNYPDWKLSRTKHVEQWSQRLPSKKDIEDLKGLLIFSDVNVNMCSTMSLDIMLFDKPVVNVAFGSKLNGLYFDQKYLQYSHYENVVKSNAVTVAKNKEELQVQINEALTKPNLRKEYREQLLRLEIGKPLEGTSKRIVEALKSF